MIRPGAFTTLFFLAAVIFFPAGPVKALDNDTTDDPVQMVAPSQTGIVTEKKPLIECRITVPFQADTLYIQLDYSDVTVLADITSIGFTLKPVQVLPAGSHALRVSFSGEDGRSHSREFNFSTRHSGTFESIYSQNSITGSYKQVLEKSGTTRDRNISQWEADGNIQTQNLASKGSWEVRFDANARYLDQDLPLTAPLDHGFELVDYLMQTRYTSEKYSAGMDLGDIVISGTRHTYQHLARRGGSMSLEYGPLQVSTFTVRSDQAYGLDGEWGFELENENHLRGGSGTLSLMDDRVAVTLAHIRGGETTDNSYGIWSSTPGGTRGMSTGISLKTDFFNQKAITVLEVASADHDVDITDGIDYTSDTAVYGEISGYAGRFNYLLSYERNGQDFQVPGNPGVQHDRQGVALNAGYGFEYQTLSMRYEQYHDNVDSLPDRSRVTSRDIGVDYSLSKFSSVPISLNWQRSTQGSENEPSVWDEIDTCTNSYSGSISYMKDRWSFGLTPGYSEQDDKTQQNYDSDSLTVTLYSTYSAPRYTLSGSVMYSESTQFSMAVDTITCGYNLSFTWKPFEGLAIEGSAGLNRQHDSAGTMDQDYLNGDVQVSYTLKKSIKGVLSPRIILKGTYEGSEDRVFGAQSDGTLVYLMLTGDLQLSF